MNTPRINLELRGLRRLGIAVGLALSAQTHASAALTVYAAMGYDQHVTQAFTKATGIPVDLIHLSTGPLLARVQAEGAHPQWDVLWFDGNLPMRNFASRKMLACGWSPHVNYTLQGRALLPADACYFPIGVTYAGVMLENTARIAAASQPKTWNDLLAPALRGKVGMDNPAISGPTYPFVAGMLQHLGQAQAQAWFERLKGNGLKVYPTNSVTLRALQYGQIDVAIVQSSAALGFAKGKSDLRIVAAPPSAELPSDVAIGAQVRGKTLDDARRFVAFLLSPAGQRAALEGDPSADSNDQPLLKGIEPLPTLRALHVEQALALDPTVWGRREPRVVSWFTTHVAR